MIQDAPPPPAAECVKAADVKEGTLFLSAEGESGAVSKFLAESLKRSGWKLDLDKMSNGVRTVRLKASIDIPYREIGGMIYLAQTNHLKVGVYTDPRICESEDQYKTVSEPEEQ